MTRFQKISSFLQGIVMICMALLIPSFPEYSYDIILTIISIGFMFYGLKSLIYYFTMARYMVGGRSVLYKAVILIDFGYFTFTMTYVNSLYILIYLAILHAITGMIELLRARESVNYGSKSWKLKFFHGLINVLMAVACVAFVHRTNVGVYIYCAGLIYSALIRIMTAFRKTTFIYIQ